MILSTSGVFSKTRPKASRPPEGRVPVIDSMARDEALSTSTTARPKFRVEPRSASGIRNSSA